MSETSTKINQRIGSAEMNMLVQAALDDPRPGDIFHEMYSFGVQVLAVDAGGVHWRSFNSDEVGRGVESREKWSQAFRYGDHMPGKHTMYLLERGPAERGGGRPWVSSSGASTIREEAGYGSVVVDAVERTGRGAAREDAARAVPAETLADRVRARFTSCWCNPGLGSGDENEDWRQEDCPVHGSGLAQHMAQAALSLLDPAEQPATREDAIDRSKEHS